MARTVTQRGPHEPAKGGWFPIRLDSRVAEQQALEGGAPCDERRTRHRVGFEGHPARLAMSDRPETPLTNQVGQGPPGQSLASRSVDQCW